MDKNSVIALMSGLLMLIVSGAVLTITGSRKLPTVPFPDPRNLGPMSFLPAFQTAGGWIPYSIMLGGPIADLYYQEIRYSILSFISISAMILGLVYQGILHGSGSVVPALVVGTSAAMVYLIQDAWMQALSLENKVITTFSGLIAIGLTMLVSNTGIPGMVSSSTASFAAALLLGGGIGELSWVTTYNIARDRLPFAKRS